MAIVVNDKGLATVAESDLAFVRAPLDGVSIVPEVVATVLGDPVGAYEKGSAALGKCDFVHEKQLLRS